MPDELRVNAQTWNARYPVGTPVVAYPITRDDAGLRTVTRTPAWELSHGAPVVAVEGHAGGIALTHVDIAPRIDTPDRVEINDEGRKTTTIKLKRACNGCGAYLGDADNRDVDDHGNLTDVRAECPNCAALVAAELAGCVVRQLTESSIGELWRWIDNGKPFYITDDSKTYGPDGSPPGLKVDGLSVFSPRQGEERVEYDRHVARWGDWIIRHPDGQWSVHKGPANDGEAR